MEVYRPESPAGCMYMPESPKKLVTYQPESPRRSNAPDPTTYLGKILLSMKKPENPMGTTPFRPVQNWRNYVESMKLHVKRNGLDKNNEIINKIVAQHEEWEANNPPKPPKEIKRGLGVPTDMSHVVVNLTVTKNGSVKVRMGAPMEELHINYYSKGVKPPIEVYLKALKDFGYPDSTLEKVLLKHQNAPKIKAQMEEVFERVFGGTTSTSKPSKPKKGTRTQEINKRLKNLGK